MATREIVILWREGEFRCEFHAGIAGSSRLIVYFREQPVTAESTPSGQAAYARADILRQRVRRGDLRAEP